MFVDAITQRNVLWRADGKIIWTANTHVPIGVASCANSSVAELICQVFNKRQRDNAQKRRERRRRNGNPRLTSTRSTHHAH